MKYRYKITFYLRGEWKTWFARGKNPADAKIRIRIRLRRLGVELPTARFSAMRVE